MHILRVFFYETGDLEELSSVEMNCTLLPVSQVLQSSQTAQPDVKHSCNLVTLEVGAEGLRDQGHPGLARTYLKPK